MYELIEDWVVSPLNTTKNKHMRKKMLFTFMDSNTTVVTFYYFISFITIM